MLISISQINEPIPGMFVLCWMHFSRWFQIWPWNSRMLTIFTKLVTFMTCRLHSPVAWKVSMVPYNHYASTHWKDGGRSFLKSKKVLEDLQIRISNLNNGLTCSGQRYGHRVSSWSGQILSRPMSIHFLSMVEHLRWARTTKPNAQRYEIPAWCQRKIHNQETIIVTR